MKVMVVGTFDVDNYGDCIFPDVLACQLSKRFPSTKIEFDLYSPHAEVARIGTYSVVKELPGKQGEVATLPRYDVAILAGGGGASEWTSPEKHVLPHCSRNYERRYAALDGTCSCGYPAVYPMRVQRGWGWQY